MTNPKLVHTVYGQRYNKYEPFLDPKTKEVLDDGLPKKIKLSEWTDLKMAENFAENVKNNTPKRMWKIWIE
jgi:hypothetical protein